ncbi:hypothetical protein [Oceanobacillus kimchii]
MLEGCFTKIIEHTTKEIDEQSRINMETELSIKAQAKRMKESRKNMRLI